MSEMLHCCDKDLNTIQPYDRDVVHKEGIWHKTSHVWFYDREGYVYFQVRADADKLYTTASGHVLAGEDPKMTAYRETAEEIGININTNNLELIEIDSWKSDTETKHDHAYAYIYLYEIAAGFIGFSVNTTEVTDIIKIKAEDLLGYLLGLPFECDQYSIWERKNLKHKKDLLLMNGEVGILKYGRILQAIHNRTKKEDK